MQEFVREYGRYIIAILAFVIVGSLLTSAALFPQYGLLSYLGTKSQIEADHLDGDYMQKNETITNADGSTTERTDELYSNEEITFQLMSSPFVGETCHINYNKGKNLFPNTCLLKTDKDNATLTISAIYNNAGEDAFAAGDVVYNYYDYTAGDNIDNYRNDDGTLIFNQEGPYSVIVNAKWKNAEGDVSTRQKMIKIYVLPAM